MSLDAATVDAILARIAQCGNVARSLRELKIPSGTFYDVLNADEDVRGRYARAKDLGLEALANEMLELSDESRIGSKTRETKDGTFVETGDMVERSKLQIETRKWLLARLLPKKYGDRTTIAGDADNPLAITDVTDAKADLARRLGASVATAAAAGVAGGPDE